MMVALRMEEVADRVWAYVQPDGGWMLNNMGLIDADDGATSVDLTSTERRSRAYLRAAATVTGTPIRRVILTHSHPDHCNGTSLLPDAEVIAHWSVANDLRAPHSLAGHIFESYEQGDANPRIPTTVFDDQLILRADGRAIEVRHPGGPAHTQGDAYVWLPHERVLFAGDLVFNGGMPFVLSGSPAGWLRALHQMAELKPATVIPGHGLVGGPELFEPVAEYLRFLIGEARHAYAHGLSAAEAARQLELGRFDDLGEPERHVGNLHRALAELAGTEPDYAAAWEDMFEFNGSRPLACQA